MSERSAQTPTPLLEKAPRVGRVKLCDYGFVGPIRAARRAWDWADREGQPSWQAGFLACGDQHASSQPAIGPV